MTLNFARVAAGIYEIQKNSKIVGSIKKANASKWIVLNGDETPQHVSKTLKDAKYAASNLVIF